MSRSQFHSRNLFILTHAWLNLWDERMTTGRINQVAMLANATFRVYCPRGRNILLRSTKQLRRFRLLPTRLPALAAGMRIGEIAYQLLTVALKLKRHIKAEQRAPKRRRPP